MCGLTGFWRNRSASQEELASALAPMVASLAHRGPDDAGTWTDPAAGIALGHRRLSILDLSEHAHQPMISEDGRYALAYNGEIYNFAELAEELRREGVSLRGRGDTETLLAGLARWGIEATLEKAIGMFAFALWDRVERRLLLARDRLGIKPLYFGTCGSGSNQVFFFSSELKALREHPEFDVELNREALALFFRHSYIPAPHTIYRGVTKLIPGQWVEVQSGGQVTARTYWSVQDVARRGLGLRAPRPESELLEELDQTLREAIGLRQIADVPLGAFLSGGIDSSLVTALMQDLGSGPVKTFTVGFHEDGFDEARYARDVAAHLHTDHTELYLSGEQAMEVVPQLASMWDEPFADASQIPTFLVSRLAREHVTVCLSGDGGDELFGGYRRYAQAERLWSSVRKIPGVLRPAVVLGLRGTRASIEQVPLPHGRGVRRLQTLSDLIDAPSDTELYRALVSHWRQPEALVPGSVEPELPAFSRELTTVFPRFDERMLLADTLTYLPDDILCKVDRASMATSLECRVPLLDHRLVEFAWSVPPQVRIGAAPGKRLLRKLLARYVPRELFERPKMGFGIPVSDWIRGPLRPWCEELLDAGRLEREGVLAPGPIRRKWDEHTAGRTDWGYHLWDVLMFQAWWERWMKS